MGKIDKETLEFLERYIEDLIHRMFVVKAIGKDNDIVKELDRQIEIIKEKISY